MMRHVLKPLAVAVAACAFCSCARTESENFNEIEDKALDIWVSSNAPDAEPLGDTGMYYEVIEALPDGSATKVDVRGRWVDVEYVIRDLNGDIVYNRNEETARLLGTFTKYTHYIPDRLYIASRQDLSDIPSGIYQAITEITPGETWRVYIPSRLAFASYGIQTSTGYGGQQALESDVPVILDSLRIAEGARGKGYARDTFLFIDYYGRYREVHTVRLSVDKRNGRGIAGRKGGANR